MIWVNLFDFVLFVYLSKLDGIFVCLVVLFCLYNEGLEFEVFVFVFIIIG